MPRPSHACALLIAAACRLPGGEAEPVLPFADALAEAERTSETTAIAAARLAQASGAMREAWALVLPTVYASALYTPDSQRAGSYTQGVATLELTLLDPANLPRLRAASKLREAQELEAGELHRTLAFQVADSYLLVLAAERVASAAERRLALAEQAEGDSRKRAAAGLVERSTVTRTELETASARLEKTRSDQAALKTRLVLANLLGTSAERLRLRAAALRLADPGLPAAPAAGFDSLLREAGERRSDLRALDARAESDLRLAGEPLASSLPRLGLEGQASRQQVTVPVSRQIDDWRLSLVASWTLYDGGARYGRRERLLAVADESRLNAEAARRGVGLELADALSALDAARAAIDQAEVQVRVAHQNADEIGARFAQGLSTVLEQADAAVSSYEADVNLARSRFTAQQAQLTLGRILGRWPTADGAPLPAARKDAP
jgi:outer membrane protein TolC